MRTLRYAVARIKGMAIVSPQTVVEQGEADVAGQLDGVDFLAATQVPERAHHAQHRAEEAPASGALLITV